MQPHAGRRAPVPLAPGLLRQACQRASPHLLLPGSGAVGVGCQRLRLCTRPDNLAQKQALAAVGQVHLMRYYDDLFTALDLVRPGSGLGFGFGFGAE